MVDPKIPMAATIVLWHENKIFLIQRHRKSGFMGNAHVFPGGRLDDDDLAMAEELSLATQTLCHQRCPMVDVPSTATAICWAALRETAEESGIFICKTMQGDWLSIAEQKRAQEALQAGRQFNEIIKTNRWTLGFEALRPVAWWLTPPVEKKRFNTFFFALSITHEIVFAPDPRETHSGQWWSPEAIFDAYAKTEVFVAPPTFAVLEDLHAAKDFQDFVQLHQPSLAICPKVVLEEDGRLNFFLPGHPNHPETIGKAKKGARIGLEMPQGGHLCSIFVD